MHLLASGPPVSTTLSGDGRCAGEGCCEVLAVLTKVLCGCLEVLLVCPAEYLVSSQEPTASGWTLGAGGQEGMTATSWKNQVNFTF